MICRFRFVQTKVLVSRGLINDFFLLGLSPERSTFNIGKLKYAIVQ